MMDKIKLVRVYAGKYTGNANASEAQNKINKFIADKNKCDCCFII